VKSDTRIRIQNPKHLCLRASTEMATRQMIVAFSFTISYLLYIRTTLTGMPHFPSRISCSQKGFTEDKVSLSTPIFSQCERFPITGRLKGNLIPCSTKRKRTVRGVKWGRYLDRVFWREAFASNGLLHVPQKQAASCWGSESRRRVRNGWETRTAGFAEQGRCFGMRRGWA
jgi:hypothetical protein